MGSQVSTPIKNGQKFVLSTKTILYKESGSATTKEKQDAYAYLSSPKFKKRALFDLNSNFMEDNNIKISINSIRVSKALDVTIHGTIKVKNSDSAEDADIVKSVLEEVLPKYAAQGEPMPRSSASYIINFSPSDTTIKMN